MERPTYLGCLLLLLSLDRRLSSMSMQLVEAMVVVSRSRTFGGHYHFSSKKTNDAHGVFGAFLSCCGWPCLLACLVIIVW